MYICILFRGGALQRGAKDRDALTSSTKNNLPYSSCATPCDRGWAFTSHPHEHRNEVTAGGEALSFFPAYCASHLIRIRLSVALQGGPAALVVLVVLVFVVLLLVVLHVVVGVIA